MNHIKNNTVELGNKEHAYNETTAVTSKTRLYFTRRVFKLLANSANIPKIFNLMPKQNYHQLKSSQYPVIYY